MAIMLPLLESRCKHPISWQRVPSDLNASAAGVMPAFLS
jgi:hypothetical protein